MNYSKENGQIIVIGAGVISKEGVMFHRTGITYNEALKFDKDLSIDEYNELLGLTPKVVIKEVYKPKVEKSYKYKK